MCHWSEVEIWVKNGNFAFGINLVILSCLSGTGTVAGISSVLSSGMGVRSRSSSSGVAAAARSVVMSSSVAISVSISISVVSVANH